jgi:hypothetical protein
MFKYCLATAILAAAAERIPPWRMQAAHGVAMMSSATKISNATIHFYCKYYAHLFVRRVGCGMCFCLDWIQASTMTHYKMQNNYYISAFR